MTDQINSQTPRSELISTFSGYPEHMAVMNDDIEALRAAIAVDFLNGGVTHLHGNTPLSLAVRLHRTRVVEYLLSVGASVHLGVTDVAKVAAQFGNERIMELLLQAGANAFILDVDEDNYCTMSHYAAQNADAGVLRALVDAGAPHDEPNVDGKRPIHFAVENENEEILSILLSAGCSVELMPDLAALAARNRNHKVLALLIDASVDIKSMDSYGLCPIHHAAQNPNVAVLRLLIDAGVDANVLDKDGENSLFKACENPNMAVLDALLVAGAEWRDVGLVRTICHAVAQNANETVVQRVIARGVDVNARDSDERTPLMTAARFSSAAVVSILLEAGADVHATDKNRVTACQYACRNENVGVVRVLLAAGAQFNVDVLSWAINESNIDALKALIDAGMNVADAVNANPRLLFDGTWSDRMLEFLIRRGVDFRVAHGGRTLYHKAAQMGDIGWLTVLFGYGADINAKDSLGRTALHRALMPQTVLALIAALIDTSELPEFREHLRWCFVAVDHADVPAVHASPRQLAWAYNQIVERQLELFRLRAFRVCVGLQGRQLPALVTCEILAHMFAPFDSPVAFHRVWAIVTMIKHFQRNPK